VPVTIKLLDLVRLEPSRHLWPEEFEALTRPLEGKPVDPVRYGVVADWLDAADEPELAQAFRWVHHHPNVKILRNDDGGPWRLTGLPKAVIDQHDINYYQTIPGLMASFYGRLERARDMARKQLADLE
jgi:hypothetical protein